MSEGYARETSLVTGESNVFDRALDVAIALTIVSFLLGMVTLIKMVQLDASGSALTGFSPRCSRSARAASASSPSSRISASSR